jgi:hypothetical protein
VIAFRASSGMRLRFVKVRLLTFSDGGLVTSVALVATTQLPDEQLSGHFNVFQPRSFGYECCLPCGVSAYKVIFRPCLARLGNPEIAEKLGFPDQTYPRHC